MPHSLLRLRVPGKLMVAGEYAVLEPHQPALVVAVQRYVTAEIALAESNHLSLPGLGLEDLAWQDLGGEVRFSVSDPRLRFVERAMAVALTHLRDQFLLTFPFRLTVESELDDPAGRKYGLGSSAAVTVAVISAILNLLGDDDEGPPAPELIFKLAAIAHFQAQGSGSGADIAASTFGGWLRYSSFQPEWLADRLARKEPLYKIIDAPWPFFSVEHLSHLPLDLCLEVGWTGHPASTASFIEQVRQLRERDPVAYEHFLKESAESVEHLVASLESANPGRALAALERNRKALSTLGSLAGVAIETTELAELNRWAEVCGGAGKPSGAGGGDCGIAMIFGEERAASLRAAWRRVGIEPLELCVSDPGVTVTRIEA